MMRRRKLVLAVLSIAFVFFVLGCAQRQQADRNGQESAPPESNDSSAEPAERAEIPDENPALENSAPALNDSDAVEDAGAAPAEAEPQNVSLPDQPSSPAGNEAGKDTVEPIVFSWEKEEGARIRDAISSSTIFRDGKYWMYYTGNGISLAVSEDGINFDLKGSVVRNGDPGSEQGMVTNPAVFRTEDGRYRMIYEGSQGGGAARRLYSAISTDGIMWAKEDGMRLEDDIYEQKKGAVNHLIFTSVPDVIRLDDDCLRIYYAAKDEIRSAKSCDGGMTWDKEGKIVWGEYSANPKLLEVTQDPDILLLPDGTYKLFFSSQDPERSKGWVASASSPDGRNFEVDDERVIEPSSGATHAMDTDAVLLPDGRYRLYYSEGDMPYPKPNILSMVSRQ